MPAVQRRRRLIGDINVVPYIDVMLVLLIIFMVTAPLLTQGIRVELPRAGAEPLDPELLKEHDPLVLSIDAGGRLYLNVGGAPTQPLDDQTVSARAAAVLRRAPDVPVLVKGDAAVSYGRVVEALVILQGAGAKKIGFLTDPPPRKRAARR